MALTARDSVETALSTDSVIFFLWADKLTRIVQFVIIIRNFPGYCIWFVDWSHGKRSQINSFTIVTCKVQILVSLVFIVFFRSIVIINSLYRGDKFIVTTCNYILLIELAEKGILSFDVLMSEFTTTQLLSEDIVACSHS